MINGKTVLAIIPARGGSKGVPRKNIRQLADKPLISWTIEEAMKSQYIDRMILSSEDEEIINVAIEWGCEVPFKRPIELAQDNTSGVDPVLHVIETLQEKYDYIVLLQPTSPLRSTLDIDGCIEFCIEGDADSCVSVTESDESPYWMYKLENDSGMLTPIIREEKEAVRRQELPKVYVLNGAVYVVNSNWFIQNKKFITAETIGYVMPKERSVDIDTELDLSFANYILSKKESSGGTK